MVAPFPVTLAKTIGDSSSYYTVQLFIRAVMFHVGVSQMSHATALTMPTQKVLFCTPRGTVCPMQLQPPKTSISFIVYSSISSGLLGS